MERRMFFAIKKWHVQDFWMDILFFSVQLDYVNQLAVYDEYTRHKEMAIFRVMTTPVGNNTQR